VELKNENRVKLAAVAINIRGLTVLVGVSGKPIFLVSNSVSAPSWNKKNGANSKTVFLG
jgi:hypothetical protein